MSLILSQPSHRTAGRAFRATVKFATTIMNPDNGGIVSRLMAAYASSSVNGHRQAYPDHARPRPVHSRPWRPAGRQHHVAAKMTIAANYPE